MDTPTIIVHSFGGGPTGLLSAMLKTNGIAVASDGGDLAVVLAGSYLHEGLEAFNRQALRAGRPYLLVKPTGAMPWVGPLVTPGRSACWACLAHRLRSNPQANDLGRYGADGMSHLTFPTFGLPASMRAAFDRAAAEVVRWCAGNAELDGVLLSIEPDTLDTRRHRVARRPQCPHCGQPQVAAPCPPVLRSRKKHYTLDGGHRVVTPSETLRRYDRHVSPLTGIVLSLSSRMPQPVEPVHVYGATYALATRPDESVGEGLYETSLGKGKTAPQARASALCEALERYCRSFQGDEHVVRSSYRSLNDCAIHPHTVLLFSEAQYTHREALNACHPHITSWIPEPFDETAEIAWTPAWSLTQQRFKYLPTAYCYDRFPGPDRRFCYTDTNGLAAGNTLEEAILQGFLELVERDGIALWWYNRACVPKVDLASFEEAYFEHLRACYQGLGRDLWVLNITSDLGIPTFAALSSRQDGPQDQIIFGFGAHYEARLAIQRALTELNQQLPALLAPAQERAAATKWMDDPALHGWQHATLDSQPYLVPHPKHAPLQAKDFPQHAHDDLLDDVKTCIRTVEARGMEMLIVDQTRPDIDLTVVKVVVPGLRHHWRRLGPGRLYAIPPQLGWLEEPLKENQLNPLTMIF